MGFAAPSSLLERDKHADMRTASAGFRAIVGALMQPDACTRLTAAELVTTLDTLGGAEHAVMGADPEFCTQSHSPSPPTFAAV